MRREEDCEPEGKYLIANRIISDSFIQILKKEAFLRLKSQEFENGKSYEKYINWNRLDNEIALFTLYAYADFKIPKEFDCIFEIENPNNVVVEIFKLTQVIYEGKYPTDTIEHGHKHICIFEFENTVPEIIHQLYIANLNSVNPPRNSIKLGICQSADFELIKKGRESIK